MRRPFHPDADLCPPTKQFSPDVCPSSLGGKPLGCEPSTMSSYSSLIDSYYPDTFSDYRSATAFSSSGGSFLSPSALSSLLPPFSGESSHLFLVGQSLKGRVHRKYTQAQIYTVLYVLHHLWFVYFISICIFYYAHMEDQQVRDDHSLRTSRDPLGGHQGSQGPDRVQIYVRKREGLVQEPVRQILVLVFVIIILTQKPLQNNHQILSSNFLHNVSNDWTNMMTSPSNHTSGSDLYPVHVLDRLMQNI